MKELESATIVYVVAKYTIKGNRLAEFMSEARRLVDESKKEAGCISYELVLENNDNTNIAFIERWQDLYSLEQHKLTKHYKDIVWLLEKLSTKFDVAVYQ